MTREDNLQIIANLVTTETASKIISKNYSDDVIEHICGYAPTIEIFAKTRYKPETVEKLMELVKADLIDNYDLMEIMKDSLRYSINEHNVDSFSETITAENKYDLYAVFRTSNVTDVTFDEIYLGIHQGVYEANSLGMVQMNREFASEMHDMGIELMICEGRDCYSYLVDLERAYTGDTYVPVQKHRLASAINEMFRQPDWTVFKEYLKDQISDMDKLTPYILKQQYESFRKDRTLSTLADKVAGEYEQYISDLKKQDPDKIIKSAYEIYNKDYIVDYCNTNTIYMDLEDIQVLLETDNVLDEIYQEWDSMTQLNGVAKIDTAIEDTAYRLKSAKAVKQVMEQRKAEEQLSDTPAHKAPKHSRR